MPDILIRDVPDDVLAAIEANARRAGLSRAEYLRRGLERERNRASVEEIVASLRRVADTFADLADEDVMRQAWS